MGFPQGNPVYDLLVFSPDRLPLYVLAQQTLPQEGGK